MPRTRSIEDYELIARLARVFRNAGYEGASLAMLAEAAGLNKASLYHRFPGGKPQMAREVLTAAVEWVGVHIIVPLGKSEPPERRLARLVAALDELYAGGEQACLLNMLAAPHRAESPFAAPIRQAFEAIIEAFAGLARDRGHAPGAARLRAERAVMLLQGSLVLARGLNSRRPFEQFLASLGDELLDKASDTGEKP